MTIGESIKRLREKANMTQKELADALEIKQCAVSHWEQGIRLPSLANVISIAKLFNTTTDEVLGIRKGGDKNDMD